jgi:hypothetical protein
MIVEREGGGVLQPGTSLDEILFCTAAQRRRAAAASRSDWST